MTRGVRTRIKASLLVVDYGIYPRPALDDQKVREMTRALEAGVKFPPIVVDKVSRRIVDGIHRHRMWQRVEGLDALVPCLVKEYADDAEIFEDAIRYNSSHGSNLTPYDRARCLARGEELGLTRESLAAVLHITPTYAEHLVSTRVTADGFVLKRTVAHLAGRTLTPAQEDVARRVGGMDQLFYIRQVIALLESDAIDWERQKVVEELGHLHALLEERLKVEVKSG